jgi:hypothetical protein
MASNLFLKLVWQVERVEQGLETPAVVQVPKTVARRIWILKYIEGRARIS